MLSGAQLGRRRTGAARGQPRGRRGTGARLGAGGSRAPTTWNCSARERRTRRRKRARRRDSPRELALPVVATHPVQFVDRDGFQRARGARVHRRGLDAREPAPPASVSPSSSTSSRRPKCGSCSPICPEALANSVEIARRCNVQMTLGKAHLPQFPTPEGVTLDDYHAPARAPRGWQQRMLKLFPDPGERAAQAEAYARRLELRVRHHRADGLPGLLPDRRRLHQLGQAQRVPVGPGRGSGAGSLVAYALGITDLDPLPYALLFERFLNPERVSMPDFDIDFCQDNRWQGDRVRAPAKYGEQAVSQIATFGTMASKAVIRDVGRVLDMPYNFCDQLSKLIPVVQNKPVSLAKAREAEPMLKERDEREDEVRDLLALAEPARGPDAQRRHARRRRADRAGQAHRLLPALQGAGHRLGHQPVRQGRRRSGRPGQVRLPRPAQPDHHPAGGRVHQRPPPGPRSGPVHAFVRRSGGLPGAQGSQHRRDLPGGMRTA